MATDSNDKKHFFDDPGNVRLVLRSFYTACAALFLLDVVDLLQPWTGWSVLRRAEESWEGITGFYGIYGFIACVLLVLTAKQMRKILMRDEDYYDR